MYLPDSLSLVNVSTTPGNGVEGFLMILRPASTSFCILAASTLPPLILTAVSTIEMMKALAP